MPPVQPWVADGMDTPMTVLSCAKPVATRAARAMTMVILRSMRFLLLVRARPRPGRALSREGKGLRARSVRTRSGDACAPTAGTRSSDGRGAVARRPGRAVPPLPSAATAALQQHGADDDEALNGLVQVLTDHVRQ